MKKFPFAAFVGQEKLRIAYLANIIYPKIGGLLISGPKGAGKSSLVHSVEDILPQYEAISDCPFKCDPANPRAFCCLCRQKTQIASKIFQMRVVSLPLSCTEDRLIGAVNVEKLLKEGIKEVVPGILGEANRNILYIDEVNLLPDHLVDDVLDAAASHWNNIEREGLAIDHPADFILAGTMNPEEGELRPQILDRFPLCVKIETITSPELRIEIVKRNLLFEKDPTALTSLFEAESERLSQLIVEASDRVGRVDLPDVLLRVVAESCSELKMDGQRPDIVIVKTARAIAALNKKSDVRAEDVMQAAELALVHRTRDGGLLEPPKIEEINRIFGKHLARIDPNIRGKTARESDANGHQINIQASPLLGSASFSGGHDDGAKGKKKSNF